MQAEGDNVRLSPTPVQSRDGDFVGSLGRERNDTQRICSANQLLPGI